ncbi:MAG: tetratricopeptide repeat protein [Nitrosomonadales bacterium]
MSNYHYALEINPEYAEAHYNLGIALQSLDRLTEAEHHYRHALRVMPNYVEAYNNLGLTLHSLGRTGEAEQCYQNALLINPHYAEAQNNLGNTYMDLNRLDEAAACYRRALEINPRLTKVYDNLGTVLMELGRIEEAENFLDKAIELSPAEAGPLTTALLYIDYSQDDPRFNQLEAVYARRNLLSLDERIKLNFAMGKAMENIGQYDRSFTAYEEGNKLHYQAYPFDEAEEERFLANSCNTFSARLFKDCSTVFETLPPAEDERVPIFIVGMPRSGSSLIEQILSGHPEIYGAGEINTFKAALLLGASIKGEDDVLKFRKLGLEYLDRVWKLAPGARFITDKLPGNFLHLGLIHLMLPNAKIIHVTRGPGGHLFFMLLATLHSRQ